MSIEDNDDVGMEVTIVRADFCGTCMRCQGPSTGSFDYDEDDEVIRMKCVGCGFKTHLNLPNRDNNFDLSVCGGD